jgi:glutamine cyclotransferase
LFAIDFQRSASRAASLAVLLGALAACAAGLDVVRPGFAAVPCAGEPEQPMLGYEVMRVLPHDPGAYTQGLLVDGDWLLESTGLYGGSSVRRLERDSGRESARIELPRHLFGEGLALAQGRLYQLTWQEGVVRIYRPDDFQLLGTATIKGEGWGLSYDGERLVQSDGSATLYFRDTQTLAVVRQLTVHAGARSVSGLNELEYVDGRIFANIYPTDCVAVIDAADGRVTGWLDLSVLATEVRRRHPEAEVSNGIAYDPTSNTYYVTGKRWPELFEIRIEEASPPAPDRQ